MEGIAKCERALALDRNLAIAHSMIGTGKLFSGQAEETEKHVLEALRLSPRDTYAYVGCLPPAAAKLYLGRDEEATASLFRSIEANRNLAVSHFYLAAARAHLSTLSEARAATKAGLELDPTSPSAAFVPARRVTGIRPIGSARAGLRWHAQGRGFVPGGVARLLTVRAAIRPLTPLSVINCRANSQQARLLYP